ncbi:MAG: ATP-grasp domain-containing protein [Deltaproteobacteria bacterium]|nr:ATP-grasp domain-containing protein [Deltaproteobacteria bacterium]
MFKKILIANRGEIARRINQVAHQNGIETVAVYSDADEKLPFVRECDQRIRLGTAQAADSYLNIEKVVAAAKEAKAEAVHPGYGFLSENGNFARACEEAGITFIGPPVEAMARMKDKSQARALVSAAGVPVVPGSDGTVSDLKAAQEAAERIGYPVLIKAAGGGGGIGMQVAKDVGELEKQLRAASDRAKSAFGREAVYLERYLPAPRHVEVQILGDRHGNLIHCFERECSIQRRHQKVVEESPSPLFIDGKNADLAQRMYAAAVTAAKSFGYANAGTCEFLVQGDEFFFIEMNARLQVEHPVTEKVTGLDLITWQLKIAAGEKLTVHQDQLKRQGAALELRIYAEDPVKFFPSPGPLNVFKLPELDGVRVDSGYEQGGTVTPYYDPMIAKLIAWGSDRPAAISRALEALGKFEVVGIKTNIPLHQRILNSRSYQDGELDTHFLEKHAKP